MLYTGCTNVILEITHLFLQVYKDISQQQSKEYKEELQKWESEMLEAGNKKLVRKVTAEKSAPKPKTKRKKAAKKTAVKSVLLTDKPKKTKTTEKATKTSEKPTKTSEKPTKTSEKPATKSTKAKKEE